MFRFATQPLSFFGLLGEGIYLYRATIRKVWLIAILLALLPVLLFSHLSGWLIVDRQSLSMPVATTPRALLLALLMLFIFFVVAVYLYGVLFHRVYRTAIDPLCTWGQSLRAAWTRYVTLFAMTVLIFLVGNLLLSIVLVVSTGGPAEVLGGPVGLWVAVASAVVWVVMAAVLGMGFTGALSEGQGTIATLRNVFSLTKGCRWRVFGTVFLPVAVLWLTQSIAFLVLTPGRVMGLSVAHTLLSMLLIPWAVATIIVLFNDLSLRKRQAGLAARL